MPTKLEVINSLLKEGKYTPEEVLEIAYKNLKVYTYLSPVELNNIRNSLGLNMTWSDDDKYLLIAKGLGINKDLITNINNGHYQFSSNLKELILGKIQGLSDETVSYYQDSTYSPSVREALRLGFVDGIDLRQFFEKYRDGHTSKALNLIRQSFKEGLDIEIYKKYDYDPAILYEALRCMKIGISETDIISAIKKGFEYDKYRLSAGKIEETNKNVAARIRNIYSIKEKEFADILSISELNSLSNYALQVFANDNTKLTSTQVLILSDPNISAPVLSVLADAAMKGIKDSDLNRLAESGTYSAAQIEVIVKGLKKTPNLIDKITPDMTPEEISLKQKELQKAPKPRKHIPTKNIQVIDKFTGETTEYPTYATLRKSLSDIINNPASSVKEITKAYMVLYKVTHEKYPKVIYDEANLAKFIEKTGFDSQKEFKDQPGIFKRLVKPEKENEAGTDIQIDKSMCIDLEELRKECEKTGKDFAGAVAEAGKNGLIFVSQNTPDPTGTSSKAKAYIDTPINVLRAIKGFTNKDLEKHFPHAGWRTIDNWFIGKVLPDNDTIEELADILGIDSADAEDLFFKANQEYEQKSAELWRMRNPDAIEHEVVFENDYEIKDLNRNEDR